MNKIVMSIATAAGLAVSGLSMAAAPTLVTAPAPTTSHWYVGVGLNYNAIEKDQHRDTTDSTVTWEEKLTKHRWGYNIFAGNRLTPHFANELGFSEVGDATWKEYAAVSPLTHVATFVVKDMYHVYYDGLFFMPLNQSVEVFLQGGLSYLWIKSSYTPVETDGIAVLESDGDGSAHHEKLETFALNYGGGIQFNWRQFALRGRYMRVVPSHDMDDWHEILDTVNLDFLYHLG